MYSHTTQTEFHHNINNILDSIAKVLNPDSVSSDFHTTYRDITYKISDSNCYVLFHLKLLPEWLCCIQYANETTSGMVYRFFIQFEKEIQSFEYAKSVFRTTFSNADMYKVLDIFKYILKEPSIAYCKAVYGGVDEEEVYMTRIKAEYKYRSDMRHRKIQNVFNAMLDNQMRYKIRGLLKRKFHPDKVDFKNNIGFPHNAEYQFVMYYKVFPTPSVNAPGEYNWVIVDKKLNKIIRKQTKLLAFFGFYRYDRFSRAIEVKYLHDYTMRRKNR